MSNQFRFEDFREKNLIDSIDLWDYDLNLVSNVANIFKRIVLLPEESIQLPILLTYSLIPSAMCTRLPVLFCSGKRGSGKSETSKFICLLQGQRLLSAASTFAAIRNIIASNRWWLPEEQREERNFFLAFDNVKPETFQRDEMYTLFLNGYDRSTDLIQISLGKGENMMFRVFSPKLISSVHPLFSYPHLSELHRRLLTIKFAKADNDANFQEWLTTKLEPELIDFNFFRMQLLNFWQTEENLIRWTEVRKGLRKPKFIDSHKWAISHDLITCGLVTGIWQTESQAYLAFSTYWEWIEVEVGNSSVLRRLIVQYLQEQERLFNGGCERIISPKELKKFIDSWHADGKLEIRPTQALIQEIMAELGWQLGMFALEGNKPDSYWLPSD